MPFLYQQNINPCLRLAVWKIEEPMDFFLKAVDHYRKISHPHKQLQHLAGRFLLKQLLPATIPIELSEGANGKPFLLQAPDIFFSVSHTADYAAAIVSTNVEAGIDIEWISDKALKLHRRFLSTKEMNLLNCIFSNEAAAATAGWCIKEAVFKWYGKGGVDFLNDIQLTDVIDGEMGKIVNCTFAKENGKQLQVNLTQLDAIMLSWVMK